MGRVRADVDRQLTHDFNLLCAVCWKRFGETKVCKATLPPEYRKVHIPRAHFALTAARPH